MVMSKYQPSPRSTSRFSAGHYKLIKPAPILFKHQHVANSISRLGIAFDERVGRNWFRAGIAFIRETSKRYATFA
jgi:hypothetical protein